MENKTFQWILWAITMVIFLALTLTGHTTALGLAITAVAVVWYTVVPEARSRRQ
jgi:membrane protein implicated in regulation of membrane protease activity